MATHMMKEVIDVYHGVLKNYSGKCHIDVVLSYRSVARNFLLDVLCTEFCYPFNPSTFCLIVKLTDFGVEFETECDILFDSKINSLWSGV